MGARRQAATVIYRHTADTNPAQSVGVSCAPGGTKLTDREPLQLNGAAPLPVYDPQTSQSAGSTGNHAVPENTARREQRRRLNGEPFQSGSFSVQRSEILFNRRKMLQLAHG